MSEFIQIALDKDTGEPKSICQVLPGLKCNCKCSKCNAVLVAKKGKIKEHHFAHYANTACEGETSVHLLAKEVLKQNKKLGIYYYIAEGYKFVAKSETIEFDSVETEKEYSKDGIKIIPDATLRKGNSILFVEFKKTHAVDAEKTEKIKKIGIRTIEIDLNQMIEPIKDGIPNISGMQEFLEEEKVLYRQWIFNPKHEELYKWKEKVDAFNREKEQQIVIEEEADRKRKEKQEWQEGSKKREEDRKQKDIILKERQEKIAEWKRKKNQEWQEGSKKREEDRKQEDIIFEEQQEEIEERKRKENPRYQEERKQEDIIFKEQQEEAKKTGYANLKIFLRSNNAKYVLCSKDNGSRKILINCMKCNYYLNRVDSLDGNFCGYKAGLTNK